jgi:hypothetical protein
MKPNKKDRNALDALRHSVGLILDAVAPEQRPTIYHQIKNRANSYTLRNAFGFDEMDNVTSHALADTIIDVRQRIVSLRKNVWMKARPFESGVSKAGGKSVMLFRNNIAAVMPSRSGGAHAVVLGGTTQRTPGREDGIRHFSVSPAYEHFTKKLGASCYRKWVILSGEPIANPFEGATVWALSAYEYKADTTIQVFGGRCMDKFIARPTVRSCVNELRRIAGQAVYEAMRGEQQEED